MNQFDKINGKIQKARDFSFEMPGFLSEIRRFKKLKFTMRFDFLI